VGKTGSHGYLTETEERARKKGIGGAGKHSYLTEVLILQNLFAFGLEYSCS